jgi:hypothetical protein
MPSPSAHCLRVSAASIWGLSGPVCAACGSVRSTRSASEFLGSTGLTCLACGISGASREIPPSWSRQLMFSAEATRALHAPALGVVGRADTPTCPGGSLPWPDDCAHDGWSARTFLHQMLCISRSDWSASDTESLLSNSTLATSQLRVAGGSSLSDALLPTAPASSELYLTPQMVKGLLRRAKRRRRPLQRVLLRTPCGWRRRIVTYSSQKGVYELSIPSSASISKDSPEAGLMAFLEAASARCSGTPSTSGALSGSGSAS